MRVVSSLTGATTDHINSVQRNARCLSGLPHKSFHTILMHISQQLIATVLIDQAGGRPCSARGGVWSGQVTTGLPRHFPLSLGLRGRQGLQGHAVHGDCATDGLQVVIGAPLHHGYMSLTKLRGLGAQPLWDHHITTRALYKALLPKQLHNHTMAMA